MSACTEEAETYHEGFITCDLPPGHDGLHYDTLHDVSWRKGPPDE